MWTVTVWDDRDVDATDPASSLGDFPTERQAQEMLDRYMQTEHGEHIYRWEIENASNEPPEEGGAE